MKWLTAPAFCVSGLTTRTNEEEIQFVKKGYGGWLQAAVLSAFLHKKQQFGNVPKLIKLIMYF